MESILEQQRRLHEERERLVDIMSREMLRKKPTHKEQINSEHRLKEFLDRYMESTQLLKDLYEDKDGARRMEINAIGGPNELAEFYTRFKQTKDFYKLHPDEVNIPMALEFHEMIAKLEDPERFEENLVDFSGEENYGKCLDLHESYDRYINLKGLERVDYVTYLTIFDRLFEIPKERKTGEYRKYIEGLLYYLSDFITRIQPLLDVNNEVQTKLAEFEREWELGMFPGWGKEAASTGALAHTGAYLDLSPFNSADELMALGLDRLKSALMALGLKCGGSLRERAERLFSTKGRRIEELDPSLKAAAAGKSAGKDEQKERQRQKEIAMLEAQVYRFVELVSEQRKATKENVERKQARTVGEKEEEEEEAEAAAAAQVEAAAGDSDDDDIPYNPKNLPLDWDGKPIPYWLYKLHGLNIKYPCEICGNQVYRGPKAFQRHFSEWRHAHGMRCLGIPNTAHFANVVKIKDALELWAKLREDKEHEQFKPELEEEFEDSLGNVVNRRTFEDLKRQGLL